MDIPVVKRDTIAARRAAGTPRQRAQRRQLIVEAAVRVIEESGTAAGLGTVAERAGLPRPHVYRHFPSRDDLDRAVARHAAQLLTAWIRPSLPAPDTPPEAAVHRTIGRVLAWAVEHPHLYRFRARLGATHGTLELAAALRPHLPAYVVASLAGMVDAGILWWFDHRDEVDRTQLNDWLATQVCRVIAESARIPQIPAGTSGSGPDGGSTP
ncbi:TetR/AcrR family transcriptional regulator [Plantactinospora sp. GCM10030261]|uniref:TetR/AcrR family transcriptional regulator n=1 Tax=Plantactinospora sp. GCM10030261 TaxID=3273420 RepID=UPI0036079CE6